MRRAWLLALIAFLVEPAKAPLIKQWQLEETATAPVLAVCQVDEVTKGDLVPAGVLKWQVPTDYAFTELEVLRAFRQADNISPKQGDRIRLQYYSYHEKNAIRSHFYEIKDAFERSLRDTQRQGVRHGPIGREPRRDVAPRDAVDSAIGRRKQEELVGHPAAPTAGRRRLRAAQRRRPRIPGNSTATSSRYGL